MKGFIRSSRDNNNNNKWQRCHMVEVAAKPEEDEEEGEVKVKIVVEDRDKIRIRVRVKEVKSTPNTRQPGILTNHHSNHVPAIGFSGKVHISVKNQVPVLGRTTGFQNLINEIQDNLR